MARDQEDIIVIKRRGKYTSKACIPCRQSKIKCTGGSICQSCRRNGSNCTYPVRARVRRTPPSRSTQSDDSVIDRLKHLEEQVGNMRQMLPVDSVPGNVEIFTTDEHILASLSSHINAVKRSFLVHIPPTRNPEHEMARMEHLGDLPAAGRLNQLVDLYFNHLHAFFPCVDEEELRNGISQFGKDGVLSGTFYKLMCMVLAVATYLDPTGHQTATTSSPPGWNYFVMAEGEKSGHMDTNAIRYHTIKAIYLIHIERLTPSYHAIGMAVQSAFILGLNDESSWNCSAKEKSTRRSLWWTIFYLDRRIGQKCWKPYLIRENEALVSLISSDQYLHTAVEWARLWTIIWDAMFALGATKPARMEQIEILDAQILHAQRQVCPSLQWTLDRSSEHNEPEIQTRSRLVVFVRFCLLRLLIRQSWQQPSAYNSRGSRICTGLACDVIEAILAFMDAETICIPFGLNAVECVVEAMCHLVPHLDCTTTATFKRAVEFLESLSANLGAPRRALAALGTLAEKGWIDTVNNNLGGDIDYMSLFSVQDPEVSDVFACDLTNLDLGTFC